MVRVEVNLIRDLDLILNMMGRYWSVLVRHLCYPISEREAVLVSTSGLQPGVLMVRFLNWQHQHPLELVRNTDSWDQPQTYRSNTESWVLTSPLGDFDDIQVW